MNFNKLKFTLKFVGPNSDFPFWTCSKECFFSGTFLEKAFLESLLLSNASWIIQERDNLPGYLRKERKKLQ